MKKTILSLIAVSAVAGPACAQNLDALAKVPGSTLATVEHATAQYLLKNGAGYYSPVLGLVFQPQTTGVVYSRIFSVDQPVFQGFSDWDYKGPEAINHLGVQIAPLLTPPANVGTPDPRFIPIDNLTASQLAGALWYYRLAHPDKKLRDFPHTQALYNRGSVLAYLLTQNQDLADVKEPARLKMIQDVRNNLPSVKLISRLIDPNFVPQSYAQLAAAVAKSGYPKRVTLTPDGFPEPLPAATTLEADADFLDTLLMLSNPDEMAEFNNTLSAYQSFAEMTPEEKEGAKQLLAARRATYHLTNESSPREVLEGLYNRLSSLLVDYRISSLVGNKQLYWAYPKSDIYPVVQNIIKKHQPTALVQVNGQRLLKNPEATQLFVLDAILNHGGINDLAHNDWYAVEVVTAFKYLCAQYSGNPQNIPHLKVMLNALRVKLSARAFPYVDEGGNAPEIRVVDDFVGNIPAYPGQIDDYIRSFTF